MKLSFILLLTSLSIVSVSASEGNQHAAIFAGLTTGESTAAPTIGAEYEYKLAILDGSIGVGAFYENLGGDHSGSVYGGGVIYHLPHHFKVNLGVGSHSSSGHNTSIIRVGGAYDYHIEKYSISPTVNMDRSSHGSVIAYGAAFGMSF